jgi:RNase P/RNase MRP subunit p30
MKLINTTNLNEARKQIEKARKEDSEQKIALLSQDDEFNRKALEIKGLNMLIINENIEKKDYSKQRDSSLNEILAKLAKDKKIEIGIQIQDIINKDEKEKAKSLARLKQNIDLCKCTGTKLVFLTNNKNKQNNKALQSLLLTLGASTKQAFESVKE